ncbi:MAG: rane protein [Lacunisphaera sp.]|nr:rane protein [Lacunisphaera sp.]
MLTSDTKMIPATIRFSAKLEESRLTLPKTASAKLATQGVTTVEATLNGFPFRAPLEPDGRGSHGLKVNEVMLDAAGAETGDTVTVEITRVGDEPATRLPADLRAALAAAPRAQATWDANTPNARQNWILWLSSCYLEETRVLRIKKAVSMLGAGKKRVCCFGGLTWLRKDHKTAGENWVVL